MTQMIEPGVYTRPDEVSYFDASTNSRHALFNDAGQEYNYLVSGWDHAGSKAPKPDRIHQEFYADNDAQAEKIALEKISRYQNPVTKLWKLV